MKCAFVIPSWCHQNTHLNAMVSTVAGLWPPTGILYIAACLMQQGDEVIVLDGALLTDDEIISKLDNFNPILIGISSVYPLWEKAKKLAFHVRDKFKNSFILMGGQAPTHLKEKCFEECEVIDAVVKGEGEEIICEIVNCLKRQMDYTKISGTIMKKDGIIYNNDGYGIVKDLDKLPFPAFELIDLEQYRPSIGLFKKMPIVATFTSRGCPMNCIYCSKISGKTIRCKSPERIGEELEYYVKKFGIKEIKFFDDLFTFDKKRAIKICQEIQKRNLGIVWSASSRVDTIDEELLKAMKASGCWYIHYGIESGVQKNLDTLKKGTKIEQIKKTIQMTHKMKINTFTSYILGIPGETYQEAEQTIKFACELNSLFSEFFFCTAFPGTELFENISKYGVMKKEIDLVGMHMNSFHPYTLTDEQMEKLRRKAFLSYYLRWGNFKKQVKSIESFQDLYYKYCGFKAILKLVIKR